MPDMNMQTYEELQRHQLVTEFDIQSKSELEDYQVQFENVDNPTQAQDNLVVGVDGRALPHWNESVDFDTWIKMDIGISGKRGLLIHGNEGLSSESSGIDTFIVFDDFSTDQLGTYWTEDIGSFSVAGGILSGTINSWLNLKHPTGLTSGDDWRIYTRMKAASAGGACVVGVGTETGHNYLIGDWGGTWGITALVGATDLWEFKRFASSTGYVLDTGTALDDTYHDVSISKAGTTYKAYLDEVEQDNETITAGDPTYLHLEYYDDGAWDYVYLTNNVANEPTYMVGTPKNISTALKSFGRAG